MSRTLDNLNLMEGEKLPKDMLLMMKDKLVMRINFTLGTYDVIDELLLPWSLKGLIRPPYPEKDTYTKYDITQIAVIHNANASAVQSWLARRVLPIDRENAKRIYNLIGIDQIQSDDNKAKFAIMCRAVSLQDNYWVKLDGEKETWNDVNIRTNPLNGVLTQVALHGTSLTLSGSIISPEITGQGAYAKAWKREDGDLWLYKAGAKGNWESKIEVMVSNLLDCCNVEHLHYEAGYSQDLYCCKCKCMTTEDISMLSGMDFISYCNINGLDPDTEMLKIDSESIYKMWIVDYLISNKDRHSLNWGFFFNCDTMEILGCHPLYDHNNAFDIEYMKNKDSKYQFGEMTLREAAKEAIKKVDFHFTKEITRGMFLTDRQYQSFLDRARDLDLIVV